MSDIEGKMAEWRKTLWGTGPCPDLSQENFRLTDEEREANDGLLIGGGMRQTDAEYREEIARLRLTDEEREAVDQAAIRVEALCQRGSKHMAATLRGLLERL